MLRCSLVVSTMLLLIGCGPNLSEHTLSVLNTEADKWQGGNVFVTNATDGWGNPLSSQIEKGPVHFTLEVRSNGPDGLPKNSDDVIVYRRERHGESTFTDEAKKSVEKLSKGATSGAIQGIKEGLGIGGKKEKE